jgi:pimeloyl-ACP methyl ester carboxylesterase
MARDVLALIEHLRLDAVDVIGFSMGCGTTAGLLMLHPPQVKPAILAGVGDYVIQDTVMDFPKKLADSGLCSATHHRPGLGRRGSKDSGRGRNCSRTPRLGRSPRCGPPRRSATLMCQC